jgi:predicted transposase/invertase (TIGR01784 family)
MKNLPTFAEKPDLWDDPYFNEMIEEAEYASMNMEQRYQYALAMKQKWDHQNQLDFAERKGHEEEKIETARRMLADKVPAETIMKYTGLTPDQLREL